MKGERFERLERIASVIYVLALVFTVALLVGNALSTRYNTLYHWTEFRTLNSFTLEVPGRETSEVTLPITVTGIAPGETVVLSTTVHSRTHDALLVQVAGSPLNLYVNDILTLPVGMPDTFPAFQKNPAPVIEIIPLPEQSGEQVLRFEYTMPAIGGHLSIPEVYAGDSPVLFSYLLSENGLSLAFSVLLLFGGTVLMGVALLTVRRVPASSAVLWLGLSCLMAGLWGFCRNDLVIYLIPAPSLLYTLSCLGLFTIGIPFLKCGNLLLDLTRTGILRALYLLMMVALFAALILHLTGVFPFALSMPIMQFLTPIALVVFAICVVIEHFMRKNSHAFKYIAPCVVFALFAVIDVVNSRFALFQPDGILLQAGVLVFALWVTVLAWGYVSEVFDEADKSARLEVEISATKRNLDMQRTLYDNLTQSTEEVRALRHDLRHQLNAIRGYLQKQDVPGALHYVETITGNIPELGNKLLCDNFAVNAVAVHYLDDATEKGIQIDIKLVVPEDLGRIPDNDMSVIVGNLFENAIEASLHVDKDKRFIKITSKVDKGRLTLVIDNSFDGTYRVKNGEFYSRKREGKGIGIASVRAVVEKYDGSMKYEVANGVFMTSLYVKM
ncbi:MAG: GHKL domain-containing protein [Coriobacteriales bacterium]|jgi:signal transduction histidine kinase|nr:GHKL domain-containing protein [Coriobacteriales bacterium]